MTSKLHASGLVTRRAYASAFAASVAPLIRDLHASGLSLRAIGEELDARGISARRGGAWTPTAVKVVLASPSLPDEPVAAVLDRSRAYGEVCGMPGVRYAQDGVLFRHDGTPANR
jgi:hypothetical protein